MIDSPVIRENAADPDAVARARAHGRRLKRNLDWLNAHWDDLLPDAHGRYVAVAGQEAFVADTYSIEGLGFMRIVGEWRACNDGLTRPTPEAGVRAADGSLLRCVFLIDCGADRTVLAADILEDLGFNAAPAHEGMALQGITGECGFVVVRTVVEPRCDDGAAANMRGEFAPFTDPSATDMSILGRDVLNKFDVILSHQRDEIVLLATNHRYRVEPV